MPLLQFIVQEFDRELSRLHALRRIVVGLGHTPALVRRYAEAPYAPVAAASMEQASAKPTRKPRRDAGERHGPQKNPKNTLGLPRALASTMPSGPVVFYPGRAPALQAEPVSAEPAMALAVPERTLEELEAASLALAAQWATGPMQGRPH